MRWTFVISDDQELRLRLLAVKTKRNLRQVGLEMLDAYLDAEEKRLAAQEATDAVASVVPALERQIAAVSVPEPQTTGATV